MRNAALILGLIGGLMGLLVGVASYGYTSAVETFGEVEGLFEQVTRLEAIRAASVIAPILALAGAGMVKVRALWGGLLLLASVAGMYLGFGLGFFTLFPMTFCAVAGIIALAAGRPDEPKAHF
ncbi:MAG: hypothetical protein VXY45_15685 [Pseudomonadota bacterium]|uniref:hypothetical protein n=1 Tax=Pseudooceanicola nitratireducens TaxID=517719 RepID=UPI001C964D0A|nr:hypothetical protein [Pseudooceanicola nitratireducens]MBY6156351.1 hypothetical protein [Pseudooceanicola nitratireducens]MEC7300068.1 hypothetical protein [Pseudomonadota bacterium]MEC8669273.1 hypothetical protein [Pseudomonadota bacterium]